ncbi:MAG: PQQ-dependent sugar dehydrogenase [Gemmatimonadetes bacterium]|nr:PQQ-dependent sugar dehydrogenase [Gemmatimonadota bacterium]MYB97118.1 PQQ-dependent sugar dehydrogenase [Gemmatimonadota bacterium]MYI46544.1 PQQ-dependent sugar dehydrogenase [Gemmatimonadota bacterium]
MARAVSVFLSSAVLASVCAPVSAQTDVHRTALHDFRVVPVAEGFEVPWSIAFLPDGDILVTERAGRLRIVRDGKLLPDPVPGTPEVVARGQGGLMDVVLHPDFESNRMIYLSFSKPREDLGRGGTTAVIRGTFENGRFTLVDEVFEAVSRGGGHYGCRLAFDADGYLYLSVGDRMARTTGDLTAHPAQDISNHHGVIVRLNDDGTVPGDNPFTGREGARPEIWSYGHRNPQGLAIHPGSGAVWLTEHGPQGGDEVNVSTAGANYGWPVIGYGVNYGSGTSIHSSTHADGMEQPVHIWVPSIGVSGLAFYTGDRFPEWRGNLFAGGLAGQNVDRLTIEDGRVVDRETILRGMGRVRDVREGPDGYIYVALESRGGEPTAIVRLEPVG